MNRKFAKRIAILSLLLALSFALFAQDDDRKVQNFSGTLAPGSEKTFKISPKVGQYINAVITSERGNAKIAEEEGT